MTSEIMVYIARPTPTIVNSGSQSSFSVEIAVFAPIQLPKKIYKNIFMPIPVYSI